MPTFIFIKQQKPTQNSFCLAGEFHMDKYKNKLLSFVWVALVLSGIIIPTNSYACNGEDLLQAARTGNLSKIRSLLEKGVDISYQDHNGQAALMVASSKGHKKVAQTLLSRGAKIDQKNNDGYTALISASHSGHTEVVQMLLDQSAKINHSSESGFTALMIATMFGRTEIMQILLAHGANINLTDYDGRTALGLAQNQQIKKLLEAAGATAERNEPVAVIKRQKPVDKKKILEKFDLRRKEDERIRKENERRDTVLLNMYTNGEEIDLARERNTESVIMKIVGIKKRLNIACSQLDVLQKQADEAEQSESPALVKIIKDIMPVKRDFDKLQKELVVQQKRLRSIQAEFEADKKRFFELKLDGR